MVMSGGEFSMTDNVLYGAAIDEQIKHRTLTVERAAAERQGQIGQRFTGSTSSQLMTEPGDTGEGAYTGRCCGVWLMLVLIFVVAIIAVAALVLSIIGMFRVYPVCDCSSGSTSPLPPLTQTTQDFPPTQPPGTPSTQELVSIINNLSSRVDTLSNTRANGSLLVGTSYTSVISDFNLFGNCTTRIEARCNVTAPSQPGDFPFACETMPDAPIEVSGKFTMSMRCVRPSPPADGTNALVATLGFYRYINVVTCTCHGIQDNSNDPLTSDIECGLEVTRCTIPQTVTAEILVTP